MGYLSCGEKNGREIGTVSFTALKDVDLISNQKRCDKLIINMLTPELSLAVPAFE